VYLERISELYIINLPALSSDIASFSFGAQLSFDSFLFKFRWFDDEWHGWMELSAGEVRAFGCIPNTMNWTGFSDYGIMVYSVLPSLKQPDIFGSTLVLARWL